MRSACMPPPWQPGPRGDEVERHGDRCGVMGNDARIDVFPARTDHDLGREDEVVEDINGRHAHNLYLSGFTLPARGSSAETVFAPIEPVVPSAAEVRRVRALPEGCPRWRAWRRGSERVQLGRGLGQLSPRWGANWPRAGTGWAAPALCTDRSNPVRVQRGKREGSDSKPPTHADSFHAT
jgi:hypothetical protein